MATPCTPAQAATAASCVRPGVGGGPAGAAAGLLLAALTAAYTLWDAYAVVRFGVDLLGYLAVGNLVQVALLTVALWPRRTRFPAVMARRWP